MRGTVTKPRRNGSPFRTRVRAVKPPPVTTSFSAAWLAGSERALAHLPDRFRRPEERRRAVDEAGKRAVAPALLDVIATRNARLPRSAARDRHLEELAQPGTVVVVTGQQVGLFLGPLFTVYKAASAIVAARALRDETGRACVPVFWLQTEDHDLPEIDHCVVPTGGTPLRVQLDGEDAASSRTPVGARRLGEGVLSLLDTLREELGRNPHADEHLALLAAAYRPDATLASAFADVLSTLFADEGLVVIDPREPSIAPFAAPVHRRAVIEAAAISSTLQARSAALLAADFSEQVYVRPGSPLSFFSPDGEEGERYRLDPTSHHGSWALVGRDGGTVTTTELLRCLEQEPRRFTTSALLRPLLQDTLLPTAAYVGGPGEVAYFAQLSPLYEHFGLPMPLVVPRGRFRVLDDRTRNLLEKLGLTPDDANRPTEALLQQLSEAGDNDYEAPASVEARLLALVTPELGRFGEQVKDLDPSLAKAATRAEDAVKEAIGKLTTKYGRVLARRDEVTVERVERLRSLLAPGGAPQERVYSLPYFASRFGGREFVRMVLDATVPFSGDLVDLSP